MKTKQRKRSGFTLAEVMVASTISVFILASAYATVISLAKGSESMINFTEMNTQTRQAIELFGRDARMASNVLWEGFSPDSVVMTRILGTDEDGNPTATRDYAYIYDPDTKVFMRQVWDPEYDPENHPEYLDEEKSRTLVTEVDELNFNYYTVLHAATSHPPDVKHIQLEAKLQRSVLNITNTNYIISARFMMRNKDVSE